MPVAEGISLFKRTIVNNLREVGVNIVPIKKKKKKKGGLHEKEQSDKKGSRKLKS